MTWDLAPQATNTVGRHEIHPLSGTKHDQWQTSQPIILRHPTKFYFVKSRSCSFPSLPSVETTPHISEPCNTNTERVRLPLSIKHWRHDINVMEMYPLQNCKNFSQSIGATFQTLKFYSCLPDMCFTWVCQRKHKVGLCRQIYRTWTRCMPHIKCIYTDETDILSAKSETTRSCKFKHAS